jgi:hypothetical protein
MIKKTLQSLLLFVPALFLAGCNHYYYVPNGHNMPMFREKGEVAISTSTATGGGLFENLSAFNLQAAAAFDKNIAVMANFVNVKSDADEMEYESGYGSGFELAAGYYRPLAKRGSFEVYAGGGTGRQHHEYGYNISSDMKMNRYFIQPGVGIVFHGFEAGVSTRICYLTFRDIEKNGQIPEYELQTLDKLERNSGYLLFEPGLTLRGGWKYIKLQVQVGLSSSQGAKQASFDEGYAGIGLIVRIAERFNDDKAANTK